MLIPKLDMNTICTTCNNRYGDHFGDSCPDGKIPPRANNRGNTFSMDKKKSTKEHGLKIYYKTNGKKVFFKRFVSLHYHELPEAYLYEGNRCWLSSDNKMISIISASGRPYSIVIGETIKEEYFREIKRFLRLCGKNLEEVNAAKRAMRSEVFVA